MKTKSVFCMMLFAVFSLFTACDNNEDPVLPPIYDVSPVEFYIYVQDEDGHDLLNSATKGNILEQGIKAVYDNKEFKLNELPLRTRYYMPTFYGLRTVEDKDGRYSLFFGEFDGAQDWDYTSFSVDWGDGTTDHFGFENTNDSKNSGINIERSFFLNNEVHDGNTFILVKQPVAQE